MLLPDREIQSFIESGIIGYDPFDPALIQPASIDMRLDRYYRYFTRSRGGRLEIDPKDPTPRTTMREVSDYYLLEPQTLVLASTIERVRLPDWITGRLEGKSSLARMGLFVHVTAGFFDPGFEGFATLEIFNGNSLPIKLYPHMPICQMSFMQMAGPASAPYGEGSGGKYQDQQRGPVESRYWKNFEVKDRDEGTQIPGDDGGG